jgi:glyceraldehyde-3-phosphate dehydrogenase (NADP+)
MNRKPMLVGGREIDGTEELVVKSPFDGSSVATVARAQAADLEAALSAAERGFGEVRSTPSWRRAGWLFDASRRLGDRREIFARTIALEAGKPITQARTEVDRAALTLRTAGEEALRIGGEVHPLDVLPGSEGRFFISRRFPVGPVACITPFNFPLNLVAHKIAPALAAGCSFVLKPASQTPLSAVELGRLLLECGVPPEAVSVLPMRGSDAVPLVEDPRIRAVSFTGSPSVGWDLKRRAFRKKVVLELGGNAGVIVDRGADPAVAAARCVAGGFGYAGQSCISVQRVFAHSSLWEGFVELLVRGAAGQIVGDPLDERTTVGPVVSDEDAERIHSWIAEAVAQGARVLAGGTRDGRLLQPTVLTDTSPDMRVCCREVFGPVVVVEKFDKIDEAIAAVDRSDYGLQAGIFTGDLANAFAAFGRIEVGAVLVNEVPTYRADPMPYGGVKLSGTGREGPRYAIDDFTEMRLMVINPAAHG